MFVFGVRRSAVFIVVATLLLSTAWSASSLIGDVDLGPLEAFEIFRLGSYFMSGAVLAVVWPWIGRHAIAIGAAGLIAVSCGAQSAGDRYGAQFARARRCRRRPRQLRT